MSEVDYYRKPGLWGRAPDPYQVQVRADLLQLLPADAHSVLDVGCGDGFLTNALPAAIRVTGLDVSPEALQHVQRETVLGSATDLPFDDGSFDLAMANDVLEHLDDDALARVTAEMTRVARRWLLVTVPLLENLEASIVRCHACGRLYHANHHVRSWDETSLVRQFAPSFTPVSVRFTGAVLAPPPDPGAALLRAGGIFHHWDKARCPDCDSAPPPGTDDAAVGLPLLDALRARRWWGRDPSAATHVDRSELMILFARAGAAAGRLPAADAPHTEPRDLLAIDFANGLQQVGDWTPGGTLARWRAGNRVAVRDGALAATSGPGVAWLEVCVPIAPAAGDRLAIELRRAAVPGSGSQASQGGAAVRAYSWDGMLGLETTLRLVDSDGDTLTFAIDDGWQPSRFGAHLNLHVDGDVAIRAVRYVAAAGVPPVPFQRLRAGHNVVALAADGAHAYGVLAERDGWLPSPRWRDAVARPAPPALELRELLAFVDRLRAEAPRRCAAAAARAVRFDRELAELRQRAAAAAAVARRRLGLLVPTRPVQRVLVLANWFPCEQQPGLGSFVLEQVQALRQHGELDVRVISGRPWWINRLLPHRVLAGVLAYRRALARLAWREWDGVPLLDVPYLAGTPFTFVTHAATYCHALQRAAAFARRTFAFDLVHAHTAYVDGAAGEVVARRYGVPLVVTEHTNPFTILTRNPVIRRRTLRTFRRADRSWAVSPALAEEIRSWLRPEERDLVGVLRNGVDTELFRPPDAWRPDPARPRFAGVGVMHDYKNPGLLLEAFARVQRALPDAELHLVGDGPLAGPVRERAAALGIEGRVVLHGRLGRRDVAALLRDVADVLVVSSRTETFGVVVIEALASGKPVVSTRCGGPESILTDPRLGQLCANHDPEALAAAMLGVAGGLSADDLPFRRDAATAGYSLADLARTHAELYQEVARRRGTAPQGRA